MKLFASLFVLASLVAALPASALDPRCIRREFWDNGYGYCSSCSHQPQDGAWGSLYAYKDRYSFLCDACNQFCSNVEPRPAENGDKGETEECLAPLAGPSLADAFLFGIDVRAAANDILDLAETSPELALFLLTFDIVDGEVPGVDHNRHHAFASEFPSAKVVRAALEGQPEDSLSQYPGTPLPAGTSLLLDSRAVQLPDGKARLTLTAQLVAPGGRVVLETLHEANIELRLASPTKLKVAHYSDLEGDAYEIASITVN
jgi:hypothetical protein